MIGAQVDIHGKLINQSVGGSGIQYGGLFYTNKWSVVIVNNLTLPSNDVNIFGMNTEHNDVNAGLNVNGKMGCVACFTQSLTATEISDITKWGLENVALF